MKVADWKNSSFSPATLLLSCLSGFGFLSTAFFLRYSSGFDF